MAARQGFVERRRSPRFDVAAAGMAVLPVQNSVRILDISLSGVLLESGQTARQGTHGRLSLELDRAPFSAEVEVCRVRAAENRQDLFRIGARFISLSPEDAQTIARFTRR